MKRNLKIGFELTHFIMENEVSYDLHLEKTILDIRDDVGIISTDLSNNINANNQNIHSVNDCKEFFDSASELTTIEISSDQILKALSKILEHHEIESWKLNISANNQKTGEVYQCAYEILPDADDLTLFLNTKSYISSDKKPSPSI